jgi:hypothetical protein
MTLPIAFIDCETTHLSAEIGEAWEVAVILREDGDPTTDTEYVWQIRLDLTTADPEALRIGRHEERFAIPDGAEAAFTGYGAVDPVPMSRAEVVEAIVRILRGAVLVGSNPAFDERFLRKLVGPGCAQWHYRPYDIVQLAAAKIGAQAAGPLPWRTHVLSRAVGVEPPTAEAAHTALGDARWARDVHNAVMVRETLPLTWEGRAQHAIGLYVQTACELDDVRRELAQKTQEMATWQATANALDAGRPGTPRDRAERAEAAIERARKLASRWAVLRTHGSATTELRAALDGPSTPVTQTERAHWVNIADALNAAHAAGMPVGIDLDGTLTDHNAWSVIWDSAVKRWEVAGYHEDDETSCVCTVGEPCGCDASDNRDDDSEEFEESVDSDSDVLELISTIAGRLRDATDGDEYHAVGLIYDLANGRTTVADARTELATLNFRHV